MKKKVNNLKALKSSRRALRNNPTKAESMLWKALQKKRLQGRKFRRQHSIGNYIVDFYCPKELLIVELDGEYHNNFINSSYDNARTRVLNEMGFKVLRFENYLVFEQMNMVLAAISNQFEHNN